MALLQTLYELEQRLLAQATRSDAEALAELIADDFTEFGASGGVWNKADVVEQLPDQPFLQRTISEFKVKPLSLDSALVTYCCQADASRSLRSSIWRQRDGRWQMVFHQGTFIREPH
nr:nuclear transport factor 2 family protein [uncultured Pseudomonas sp.]